MAQPSDGRERVWQTLQKLGRVLGSSFSAFATWLNGVGERMARVPWSRVRPGWYVIVALAVWSLVATAQGLTLSSFENG